MPPFDPAPDKPQSFGYRISWFAVKAAAPAAVLDALEFEQGAPANWRTGLAAADGREAKAPERYVFAAPPVGGWTLVAGFWLPEPYIPSQGPRDGTKFEELFTGLMNRFAEVQFFGSYRVVDYCAWARAENGKVVRIFSYADGEVYANLGEQTPEEASLNFAKLDGLAPPKATGRLYEIAEDMEAGQNTPIATGMPEREARAKVHRQRRALPNESDVVDLAGLWSIDPTRLSDRDLPEGVGLVARIPEKYFLI